MHILTIAQLTQAFTYSFLLGFFLLFDAWLLWVVCFLGRAERCKGRITPRSRVAPLGVYVPKR